MSRHVNALRVGVILTDAVIATFALGAHQSVVRTSVERSAQTVITRTKNCGSPTSVTTPSPSCPSPGAHCWISSPCRTERGRTSRRSTAALVTERHGQWDAVDPWDPKSGSWCRR